MSKIRNTGLTDKWGFRYICYVATATQNGDYGHVYIVWPYQEAIIAFWLLNYFWPAYVSSTFNTDLELSFPLRSPVLP